MLRIFSHSDLFGHPSVGNSLEAFVIQEVINNLPIQFDINFYRTQDGSEMDLIISKGNRITAAIEIKNTNSPKLTKGNLLAMETMQSQRNFVITPSSDDYPLTNKVQVCSLERFVFHYLPLITA